MIRVFFRYKGRTILNCVDFECVCAANKFICNHNHEYDFIFYSQHEDPHQVLSLDDIKEFFKEV